MLALPATLRTVPTNLKTRCEGRRVVGSHCAFWPDELLVTRDTVFGNTYTFAREGVLHDHDESACAEAARIAAWYFNSREPHRPDGRVFYLLNPESVLERTQRESLVKSETKKAVAGVKAAGLQDKARASGVLELEF